MPVEIALSAPGKITVTIRGMLAQPEFAALQRQAGELLRKEPRAVRVLVNAAAIEGFARQGDWGDSSFQVSDRLIARMAILADPKWKDLVLLFAGKGLRRFPMEVFAPQDLEKAHAWLDLPVADT